ncbi:serine/arginine repetitive matrix protein 1 [Aspergillus brasiliensis]|uniref:Serine/arginine repetitive matrix protein 1 n=1 Tax=Aspergillus brasiliensis TaxID=319629 RepID=A0A9W5YW39_9EURO|nr:serine/arginine repetitive matrix protein 1 [Aspergillus brasiliensis]GKZ46717.1 serine/arginine repetitive matrix protein 1 [Aspergillus brasiliensis]
MCIVEEYTVSYPDVRRRRVLQRCLLGRSLGYCYRTQVVSPGERIPERRASQIHYATPRSAYRPAMQSLRHLIVDPREPARRRSPSYPRRMPPRRSDPFRVFFPFLRRASDSDEVWKGDDYRPRGRGRSPRPVIVTPGVPPVNREPRSIRRRPLASRIRIVSPPPEPLYKEEPLRPRPRSPASPSLSPRDPGLFRRPVVIHQEPKPRPTPIPSSSSGYRFRNPWRSRSPSPGPSNRHRKEAQPSPSPALGPKPQEPHPRPSPTEAPSTNAPAPLTPPRKKERRPRERSPSVERTPIRKTRSTPTVPVEVHNPPAPDSPKPATASNNTSPGSGPRHVQFSDIVDHLSISGESNAPSSPTGPPRFYRQFGSSASRRRSPTPGPTSRLRGGRGESSPERTRYVYASPAASRSYPPDVEVLMVTPRRYRPGGITPPLSRATVDICEVGPGRSSSSDRAARVGLEGSGLRVERRPRRGMGREELGGARPRIVSVSPSRGRWRPRMRVTERYGGFESGDERVARDQIGSARVWRWL